MIDFAIPDILHIKSIDEAGKLGEWANFAHEDFPIQKTKDEVEIAYNGLVYLKGHAPVEPIVPLNEQALRISLTKREFLKIILALTASMPNPVTLAQIESYVATAPDSIRLEWDYATYIERSHPALDGVANDFGITAEMLDIVFVNAQEFLRKIDAGEPLHE